MIEETYVTAFSALIEAGIDPLKLPKFTSNLCSLVSKPSPVGRVPKIVGAPH